MDSSDKKQLSKEEKDIFRDINQVLFPHFKQHYLHFYQSLLKCGTKMIELQKYYQCTNSIRAKQNEAEQKMKEEMTAREVIMMLFKKEYRVKLSTCRQSDHQCKIRAQNQLKKNLFQIFEKYYSTNFF